MHSISVIGGSDGPTSIFLAGNLGGDWINIFGLIIVLLIMIPNIIYGIKFKGIQNKCTHKLWNTLEQVGRYASIFFMIFHVGMTEFGFASIPAFIIYGIGNVLLLICYWVIWLLYFMKQTFWKSMVLALIPTSLFLLNGLTLRHYLLVASAIVFGIGHFLVTYENAK